jgi:hypothetical protein
MRGEGNPMKSQEVREKVSAALRGVPREHLNGGNGTGLTKPQRLLMEALPQEWTPEYVVWGRGAVKVWPLMIVDLAIQERKWAIEVDGASHNSIKVRERDSRKDQLLADAGWSVFRVTNKKILEDLDQALLDIQKFFESK